MATTLSSSAVSEPAHPPRTAESATAVAYTKIRIAAVAGTSIPMPVARITRSMAIPYRRRLRRVCSVMVQDLETGRRAQLRKGLFELQAVPHHFIAELNERQRAGKLFARRGVLPCFVKGNRVVVMKVFFAARKGADAREGIHGLAISAVAIEADGREHDHLARRRGDELLIDGIGGLELSVVREAFRLPEIAEGGAGGGAVDGAHHRRGR